jgi:Fe-S cluster assembly iron-binding protein IscA
LTGWKEIKNFARPREVTKMLEVTAKAAEKLQEYLDEQRLDSAIRIFVSQIG